MIPHCKLESQYELFESPAPAAEPAPKIALPFQRAQEIDVRRTRKILGVSSQTVYRLIGEGLIRGYQGIGGFRVEYLSVVEFCDQLCLDYGISRRAARPAGARGKDRDILPFPLDETVYLKHVMERLDCSKNAAIHRIEQGELVAYKIGAFKGAGAPWRIHESSVDRYIASKHSALAPRPRPTP